MGMCGFDLCVGWYKSLLPVLVSLGKGAHHAKYPANVPLAVMSGEDDMCTLGDTGVHSYESIQRDAKRRPPFAQGLHLPSSATRAPSRGELCRGSKRCRDLLSHLLTTEE